MVQGRMDVTFFNRFLERVLFVDIRMEETGNFLNFLFHTINMGELEVLGSHWVDGSNLRASSYLMEHRSHVFLL